MEIAFQIDKPLKVAEITADISSGTLSWPTINGQRYQLEYSSDMKTWHPNPPIIADGDSLSDTVDAIAPNESIFFRVRWLPE